MAVLMLKQQFTVEYIISGNATQAAGYSPKYANTNASYITPLLEGT